MVDSHFPIVSIPVCFNQDPFDPAPPTPQWTDLAPLVTAISTAKRGRQYELDTTQTGEMQLSLLDRDEKYNPLNTASALSPNVQPYRKVLAYATWPNPPGNLFNLTYNNTDGGFESYINGTAMSTLWAGSANFNCTANTTVTTTNPRTGTKSATFAFNAGVNPSWLFVIPTVPGTQYTASAWVRQTAANPLFLFINGGAAGATNSTVGAYVRLTVTFIATATTHQLVVAVSGASTNAATVNVDDVQLDIGAAALTNTATGGLQRSFWTAGYVERWPSEWIARGFQGVHTMPCVGPFFALQNQNLQPELRGAILAKNPDYYWPLTESGQNVTSFAEVSGHGGPPLVRYDSKYGPGTFDAGAAINVLGAPGDGGVHMINNLTSSPSSRATTILTTGQNGTQGVNGPVGSTFGFTMAFVMSRPAMTSSDTYVALWDGGYGATNLQFGGFTGGNIFWVFAGSAGQFIDQWHDGKPHLFILTVTATAGSWVMNAYVDNTQPLVNGTSALGTAAMTDFWFQIGDTIGFNGQPFGGFNQEQTTVHMALWNRTITGPERADLYNAFVGYAGPGAAETTGQRLTRWMTVNGLSSLTGDIQAGSSVTGISDASDSTGLLDGGQGLAKMEFGNFYESATGVAFRGRADRYLKTVPSIVFGENAAAGEYPYLEDIVFDFDPTYVFNEADITRPGGIKAHAEDLTSQKRFGRKTFADTMNYATDNDAQDAAWFVVNYYKAARGRLEHITIDVATGRGSFGDGTMWPGILQLEIGQLVRVMRRAKAANSAVGFTYQQDCFIENIEHSSIDFEAGAWTTILQLSPAIPIRPWILEDATYGLLESTTYLAF